MHQTIFSLSGTCLYLQLLQDAYLYSLSFFANVLWTKSSLFFTFRELNRRCPRVNNKQFKADPHLWPLHGRQKPLTLLFLGFGGKSSSKILLENVKYKGWMLLSAMVGHIVRCLGGNVASWITYSCQLSRCGSCIVACGRQLLWYTDAWRPKITDLRRSRWTEANSVGLP